MTRTALRPDPARAGNAIFGAMLMMSLAVTVIITTQDMGVAAYRSVRVETTQSRVLAALDAVLARRQQEVINRSTNGRPEDFVAWDKNYGVDFVGDIEVRWKTEPAWTRGIDASNTVWLAGNPAPSGAPPPGDPDGPPASAIENRGSFYLYRIAGEARQDPNVRHNSEDDSRDVVRTGADLGQGPVRAQGVRYVVTPNVSALNYLLYYALRGPKADIEVANGWSLNLIGDIYTGGSLYLGGGNSINSWASLRKARSGSPDYTTTDLAPWLVIGPPSPNVWPTWSAGATYNVGDRVAVGTSRYQCKAGHAAATANQPGSGADWRPFWHDVTEVRVLAIDGVYRLSKHVMYSAVNSFPMSGTPPTGYSLASAFSLSPAVFPNERAGNPASASYRMPDPAASTIYDATWGGRIINPMRIGDSLSTRVTGGSDDMVRIMGVPMRGVDEALPGSIGNDSRDRTRTTTSGFVWRTGSMGAAYPGFNRMVRTGDNGQGPDELAPVFQGRPAEAQKLEYPANDLDGDPTTDEHEYALPKFVQASGGVGTNFASRRTTAAFDAIEEPGFYLEKALGNGSYMARRTDYTGYTVVNADGVPVTSTPSNVGLIIRERPRPATDYYTPNSLPTIADPRYMPYNYGKIRPSPKPFSTVTVSGNGSNLNNGDVWGSDASNAGNTVFRGFDTSNQGNYELYRGSGQLELSQAMDPAAGQANGYDYSASGWDDNGTYRRFPLFYQDHWRFVHLRKPTVTTGTTGLTAYYFNDRVGGRWQGPFGGRLLGTRVDAQVNHTEPVSGITGMPGDYYSIRWMGFIKAATSATYTMTVNSDDGARLWIDNRLVVHAWNNQGPADRQGAFTFAADVWYPIVLDYYDNNGAANCQLYWEHSAMSRQLVPTTALAPATKPAFDWNVFTSVVMRLDNARLSGPDSHRVGLMLRPAGGVSPITDGRDPYLALTFSRNRGVTVQVRGERSASAAGTGVGYFVGQAALTAPDGTSDTVGEIVQTPVQTTAPAVTRQGNLVFEPRNMTVWRNAGEQSNLTVYTPGSGAPPTHPYNGMAVTPNAWPVVNGQTSGTNTDWNKVKSTLTYHAYLDSPTQGRFKDVRFGQIRLITQRWPRMRSRTGSTTNWNLRLGGITDGILQRFRWDRNAGGASPWPAGWNTQLPNDHGRSLMMFAEATGNRIFRRVGNNQTNWDPALNSIADRRIYQLNNEVAIDTAGLDAGGRLSRTFGGGDSGTTNYVYWFPDDNGDLISDVAQPYAERVIGSNRTFLYTTSAHGLGDTIPKLMNGSVVARNATIEEVKLALSEYYGTAPDDWSALQNADIAYPTTTPANPVYRAGVPTWGQLALVGEEVPAALRTATALPATASGVSSTFTINTSANTGFIIGTGDLITIHSAAGTEHAVVTAHTTTKSVTVLRGQRGTTGLAHAAGALVTILPMPVSALAQNISATDTVLTLHALPVAVFGIRVGDVLTLTSAGAGAGAAIEQIRVTAVNAAAGQITVQRGVNNTSGLAWVAPQFPAVDTNVNDGNTNSYQVISPPTLFLGGTVAARVNQIGGVAAGATSVVVDSVAAVAIGDVLLAGQELVTVEGIAPATSTLTLVRGQYFSTTNTIPNRLPLLRLTAKTFAIDRSRTVNFDINAAQTAGMAPQPTWRSSLATRGNDVGWYWSQPDQFALWKSSWSNITPSVRTGGFAPRWWERTRTAPDTVRPTIDVPASPDALPVPANTIQSATGRWSDDQPASHAIGASYNPGDLVFSGGSLYRCRVAHTASASTQPPSTTTWEAADVWLRLRRVAGTSLVRAYYAVAASAPASEAEWQPVLAVPETAIAAAPRPGSSSDADSRAFEFDLARWFRTARLAGAVANTTANTTITLTANPGWTAGPGDVLALDDELVQVVSGSGTTLTVARAFNGTAAASHAANILVTGSAYRGSDLLVGVCANSGTRTSFGRATITNLEVQNHLLPASDADYDINATDWDNVGGAATSADETRYLASQYQVFIGNQEITEDILMFGEETGSPILREDWFYNLREFWSQSRWWDDGIEKDPGYVIPTDVSLSNREILAKTTLLSVDMRNLQDYLRSRTLDVATSDRLDGGYTGPSTQPATLLRDLLPDAGLIIHVSRTNRYPWNPQFRGKNPYNPNLPNETSLAYDTATLAATGDAALRSSRFATQVGQCMDTMRLNAWNLLPAQDATLQPWDLAATAAPGALMRTPPIRPQDFHHGVRIINGESIDWDHDATNGTASGSDKFGTSKLSFVTPNHLYVQGDLNTVAQPVDDQGVLCAKSTPIAVYGDSVTYLSNNWNDWDWQQPGLRLTWNAGTGRWDVGGNGSLAYNQGGLPLPVATPTSYAAAVLTHNNPTTRMRVAMGEASAVEDVLLGLEGWANIQQTFIGSIVVMDTRRYSDAYRLDQGMPVGLSPMGFMGNDTWMGIYQSMFATPQAYGTGFSPIDAGFAYTGTGSAPGKRWQGRIEQICGIPNRDLFYNPDFKTKPGTPPEMPFGIKTVGVGGWVRVLQ